MHVTSQYKHISQNFQVILLHLILYGFDVYHYKVENMHFHLPVKESSIITSNLCIKQV